MEATLVQQPVLGLYHSCQAAGVEPTAQLLLLGPSQTARRAGSPTTPNQDALLGCLGKRVDREKTCPQGTVFLFCRELLVLPSEPPPAGSTTQPRKGLRFVQSSLKLGFGWGSCQM